MAAVDADRPQHRAALERALGERFVDTCAETMSPSQVACARAAADGAALAACTHR